MEADKIQKQVYSTDSVSRAGHTLVTFYNEDHPIGSLLLDPDRDALILNDIENVIDRWNTQHREQKAKEDRIRQDGKRGRET